MGMGGRRWEWDNVRLDGNNVVGVVVGRHDGMPYGYTSLCKGLLIMQYGRGD